MMLSDAELSSVCVLAIAKVIQTWGYRVLILTSYQDNSTQRVDAI